MKQIISNDKMTKKMIYEDNDCFYYSVAFLGRKHTNNEPFITICVSSQIGCSQSCSFCATGSHKYIKNLSSDQICKEIIDGLSSFDAVISEKNITHICVIFEGMGEAAHNFDACCRGFHLAWNEKLKYFENVDIRFSTVAPVGFDQKLQDFINNLSKYPNTSCQVKLSLHTPITEKRRKVLCDKSLEPVDVVIDKYEKIAKSCNYPLVCNYVLMEQPGRFNNYDDEYLAETIKLLKGRFVRVWLGTYSETGKNFYSPDAAVYRHWSESLEREGIDASIVELKGADISAACGMLHYK